MQNLSLIKIGSKSMNDKNRKQTRVAVYLIGKRDNTILLGKRKNTGHMDGYWSLIAGHVREGESSTKALVREVFEECGINLKIESLSLIGAMLHKSPPYDYINFVFQADLTAHHLKNMEEDKCEALAFYPINELPSPMENYIVEIIKKSIPEQGLWISEYGW